MSTRRDEIVAAARRLFSERGYELTTTRDVGAACGIQGASLYSHFRTKADLMRHVVGPFFDSVFAAQDAALALKAPGIERLDAMIRSVGALSLEHSDEFTILHYNWLQIRASNDLQDVVEACGAAFERWRRALAIGVDDRSIRDGIDPLTVTHIIASAIQAVVDRLRNHDPASGPPPRLDVLVEQFREMMLAGLRREPARTEAGCPPT